MIISRNICLYWRLFFELLCPKDFPASCFSMSSKSSCNELRKKPRIVSVRLIKLCYKCFQLIYNHQQWVAPSCITGSCIQSFPREEKQVLQQLHKEQHTTSRKTFYIKCFFVQNDTSVTFFALVDISLLSSFMALLSFYNGTITRQAYSLKTRSPALIHDGTRWFAHYFTYFP